MSIISANRRWSMFGAASAIALTVAAGATAANAQVNDSGAQEVVVTGTRERAQTQFTALSPVDVFSAKAINSTVTSQLDEVLAELVPSFDVSKLPASDGPEFVRPAQLDALAPDMTLLLLNGKRFHRTAFLNNNTGSQAPDLAQIPTFDIDHVEVLRDGASAQYGTDAIAGVINIILNTKPGFSAYAQASQYYAGDGEENQFGARGGIELPGGGHFVATAEFSKSDSTSRSIQRPDAAAFQAANPTLDVPNPVQRWGNPAGTTYKYAVDVSKPLGDVAEAYAFSTFGAGNGVADINWRNPSAQPAVYTQTPIFPGFNLNTIYPDGFTPHEGIRYTDAQVVLGVRQQTSDVWTWDLSASYGVNNDEFFLNNSINASLGPNSPLNFRLGHVIQSEFNLNADSDYQLKLAMLPAPINIAFGAERRVETFETQAGDLASYEVGPGAAAGLAGGANGFPGYSPQEAGTSDQVSYAGYVDATVPLTKAWTAEVALRDESYTEFGNTFNYKFLTRYEVLPGLAIRGSYSTGFKAPTPAQLNSTSTSQSLDNTTLELVTSGRLSPNNPVAQFFGAKPLTPEESKTFSGGIVWTTDFGFTGSLDVHQIEVDNRFGTSQSFTLTPAQRAQLVASGVQEAASLTQVTYFNNAFNTKTQGFDLVGSYARHVGPGQMNLTAAYSYNDTTVIGGTLAAASDEVQKVEFENGIPRQNVSASANYAVGPISVLGRLRYYGSWTDASGLSAGQQVFQKFGGVPFFDLSVTYAVTRNLNVRVGAEDIFDTYPDKATNQANRGLLYSRDTPYDTNGGNYYIRLEAKY
jgi:iron complex outermembrane receptor protein